MVSRIDEIRYDNNNLSLQCLWVLQLRPFRSYSPVCYLPNGWKAFHLEYKNMPFCLPLSLSLSLSLLTPYQCVCDKFSCEDFDRISIRINGAACISISFTFYFCFSFAKPWWTEWDELSQSISLCHW